jgi:hypothetical protein
MAKLLVYIRGAQTNARHSALDSFPFVQGNVRDCIDERERERERERDTERG